jgi:hypothetical protein
LKQLKKKPSTHGGTRPGAGMPKGYKTQKTLAKEQAREVARQIITRELEPMLAAQIAHAKGLSYLVARHKTTGKFAKLTEDLALTIAEGKNPEYEAIEVWGKDPSVQAFTDLLNRALDKPKEQVEVTGKDSGPLEIIIKKPW